MVSGALAILLIGGSLAARPVSAAVADPPVEADRQAWLRATAVRADAVLERLLLALEGAMDSARHGTALVVSGQDPPGPALEAAASALEGAADVITAAQAAVADLRGTLASVRPEAAPMSGLDVTFGDLISVAGQLRASATAAGPFVERRWAAEATLASLGDALAALDRDDFGAALLALNQADAALAQVVAWREAPPSLPYWIDTTGALLAAARAIADAALAGDADAAALAADAYRAASERAVTADRALALAFAEGGSAIAATPLRRLAEALREVAALREAMGSIADGSRWQGFIGLYSIDRWSPAAPSVCSDPTRQHA